MESKGETGTKSMKTLGGQVCQICGDTVGKTLDGDEKKIIEEENDVLLALATDILEEKHENSQLRAMTLQQAVAKHYNSKV